MDKYLLGGTDIKLRFNAGEEFHEDLFARFMRGNQGVTRLRLIGVAISKGGLLALFEVLTEIKSFKFLSFTRSNLIQTSLKP